MNEITKIALENEMDLVLAHKQCMRLAEFTGVPLSGQTTFATAVSEICRNSIGAVYEAVLSLFISDKKEKIKYITAVLEDKRQNFSEAKDEGYNYAKRLIPNINASTTKTGVRIELNYRIPPALRIDSQLVDRWRNSLNIDPPVSPYEEIKRKNRQLVEMADKLRISEQQYKMLTDSLPIMIFSVTADGKITYANKWLHDYTGETIEQINANNWQNVIHNDDLNGGWSGPESNVVDPPPMIVRETRLKQVDTGEYRWHTGMSIPIRDDEGTVRMWNTFLVDVHAQKMIEQALRDNVLLKQTQQELEHKIVLLNRSNDQLEQFAYIAAHDLQEPLRKIGFYSDFLNKKYSHTLPEEARSFFTNLIQAAVRLKTLISDVLAYSTIQEEDFIEVDLNSVVAEAVEDLEISIKEKKAKVHVDKLPVIQGNPRQLSQLFENLISNSLKFTRAGVEASIHVSSEINANNVTISIADNGIGFDNEYAERMFNIFQRLHTREKYYGTGIGLSICKKIVDMHHGQISANGTPNEGAVFLITLPLKQAAFGSAV